MNSLESKAKEYFLEFSNKNIKALKLMFNEEITLRDWEINANGINEVVDANQKIFDNCETIKVSPLNLYTVDHTVVAELDILINNEERIKVVDIIKFDKSLKITSIKAFKG
tara:strand:+ start:215 stop:547 length:333 start_codon:yes stop_codon:yes gene_type:complete